MAKSPNPVRELPPSHAGYSSDEDVDARLKAARGEPPPLVEPPPLPEPGAV